MSIENCLTRYVSYAHTLSMGRTTSTVRAWAQPPGDGCACCSCDICHADDEQEPTVQPPAERAPERKPVRQAVNLQELQEQVFGACLWVY